VYYEKLRKKLHLSTDISLLGGLEKSMEMLINASELRQVNHRGNSFDKVTKTFPCLIATNYYQNLCLYIFITYQNTQRCTRRNKPNESHGLWNATTLTNLK